MLRSNIDAIASAWERYWFPSIPLSSMGKLRVAFALFTAVWFLSHWELADQLCSQDGLWNPVVAGKLVAMENPEASIWKWSPLWWVRTPSLIFAWLLTGIAVCLVTATGRGGWLAVLVLWLLVIGWANRLGWLRSPAEPALAAIWMYLVIGAVAGGSLFGKLPLSSTDDRFAAEQVQRSGSSDRKKNPRKNSSPQKTSQPLSLESIAELGQPPKYWTVGLSVRLIQTHVWVLLAAGVLSQLASIVWWRGEAAWWLASSGASNLLTSELLQGRPLLVNGITHAATLVQFATLWLLIPRSTRKLGVLCGVFSGLVYAGVADQLFYGVFLAISISAFLVDTPSGND